MRLPPDPTRKILRPYLPPGHDSPPSGGNRVERIIDRALSLSPKERSATLDEVYRDFAARWVDLDEALMNGYRAAEHQAPSLSTIDEDERRLIGAYFLHEYSVEGAALTNPSIVTHPDQSGLAEGVLRVVISLRAVGEGHISSIEFRIGEVGPDGEVEVADAAPLLQGNRETPLFDKAVFSARLEGLGADTELLGIALGGLDELFTMAELDEVLSTLEANPTSTPVTSQVIHTMHWLASSNYEVKFSPETDLSQRILTPSGPAESHGMEDARFVRFTDSDGSVTYYGTYTAFDGINILPQLIETTDFVTFRVATLNGSAAVNKGIALFPRRIGGRYVAMGRSDGESNYLMTSDHVRFWDQADLIQVPAQPWELMQIGNAGAPIETDAGWLVITHGVGPIRQYALGAVLLDLDEPTRVIGHLNEPLLVPGDDERDGYVPNVVYSCGSLIHDNNLIIAYGASDTSTGFATAPVDAVLSALTGS
ncbi:MAG: glycoside hydrolase family 130 protein [Acidimicrobiia bacterium]